jgi:hypothetical protein
MSVITDEQIQAMEAERAQRDKVAKARDARELKLLLRILIALGIPNVALIDPKRDAFDLLNLRHDIGTDPLLAAYDDLEDELRVVKTLSTEEKAALRKRIGR